MAGCTAQPMRPHGRYCPVIAPPSPKHLHAYSFEVPSYPAGFSDLIAPLVSMVLYLCSEEPDLSAHGARRQPATPRPQKIKGGCRLFPPDAPTIWHVGSDLGSDLRRAASEESSDLGGTHASPRLHIRGLTGTCTGRAPRRTTSSAPC